MSISGRCGRKILDGFSSLGLRDISTPHMMHDDVRNRVTVHSRDFSELPSPKTK